MTLFSRCNRVDVTVSGPSAARNRAYAWRSPAVTTATEQAVATSVIVTTRRWGSASELRAERPSSAARRIARCASMLIHSDAEGSCTALATITAAASCRPSRPARAQAEGRSTPARRVDQTSRARALSAVSDVLVFRIEVRHTAQRRDQLGVLHLNVRERIPVAMPEGGADDARPGSRRATAAGGRAMDQGFARATLVPEPPRRGLAAS